MYRCKCTENKKPIALTLEYIDHLPLQSGSHTSVMPMVCGLCHKMDFMPKENWDMFVERGDPETVKEWEDGFTEFVKRQTPVAKAATKVTGFFTEFWRTICGKNNTAG